MQPNLAVNWVVSVWIDFDRPPEQPSWKFATYVCVCENKRIISGIKRKKNNSLGVIHIHTLTLEVMSDMEMSKRQIDNRHINFALTMR